LPFLILKKVGTDVELIKAVLKEKPMAIYAHGMTVAENICAFIRAFTGSLSEAVPVHWIDEYNTNLYYHML